MARHRPTRPPYRAARAFYLTLLIGVCFALYLLFDLPASQSGTAGPSILQRRDVDTLDEGERCRLVHHAKDQCAFIKKECPTAESAFAAYLDLYFCRLAHVKAVAFTILISWLGLLFSTIGIAASDFFCINLSTIATILGMSESLAGVTFLAFGNGSPDVFSTFAAMKTNSGSLAVGELFGAAGFITAVVAGSMALIRPFHVSKRSFARDVGFFVVAAAFSLVFLWDGKLRFWECILMVAFYVFYVVFVVAWHWFFARRRRLREKEAAMRGHFAASAEELQIDEEEYRDDVEDAGPRDSVREDWAALERAGEERTRDTNEEEEEAERDRWMSELNSNMRLTLPTRDRSQTLVPVRPSLVGALEFQAVLKSLQKSRNIQTIPLNARRYSDDPTWTTAQQQDNMSSVSDPAPRPGMEVTLHDDATPTMERTELLVTAPLRQRAQSCSNPETLHGERASQDDRRNSSCEYSEWTAMDNEQGQVVGPEPTPTRPGTGAQRQPRGLYMVSPAIKISPSPSSHGYQPDGSSIMAHSTNRLAGSTPTLIRVGSGGSGFPDHNPPSPVPRPENLPKIRIPNRETSYTSSRASGSPFPPYHDAPSFDSARSSLYLPSPTVEQVTFAETPIMEPPPKRRRSGLDRIWPRWLLPPPGVIISTLLPTIYHWSEKTIWEKALGIVAAPSVFLLTITLPVVETNKDKADGPPKSNSLESAQPGTPRNGLEARITADLPGLHDSAPGQHRHSRLSVPGGIGQGSAVAAASHTASRSERHDFAGAGPAAESTYLIDVTKSPQIMPQDRVNSGPPPELWNRWLLIIQIFLAPLFTVFAIYSQSPTALPPSWLVKPCLICLLISVLLLIPLLLTTTPTYKPPIYRYILSMMGFAVSIAWISAIAAQVVGALKALAVILNISHAIMGLTIFAVGNSLGDLVADVTVAKLGYPVMALSACFGGPMLNILLGIGLSGSYILLTNAERRYHKHPDKDFKFKTYHIEVSNTLLLSGCSLLVTLVGLLVFVPLNRWVFSKRIGWTLIIVWIVSTVANVLLEVTGFADAGSEDLWRKISWKPE